MSDDSEALVPAVPVWFSSGSGTGDTVTGSLVPRLPSLEPVENRGHPPSEQVENDDQFPPEGAGWFDDQGNLLETPETTPPEDLNWS